MGRLGTRIFSVGKHVLVFGLVFGGLAAASVSVWIALNWDLKPTQDILLGFFILMYGLGAGAIGLVCGAVVGLLYALMPSAVRDVWMAVALGAATIVSVTLLTGLGAVYPISWTLSVAAFASVASAGGAWIARKMRF